MIILLITIPLVFGVAAWLAKDAENVQKTSLFLGAFSHFILTNVLVMYPEAGVIFNPVRDFLGCDNMSRVFLLITSMLFFAVTVHTIFWFPSERHAKETMKRPEGLLPLRIFVPCLLAFLSTMTLVVTSRDFGLLWVAIEATTLTSAPLILFHRSGRSLEAMWKYLLICSVGIGLALFGTMMLTVSGGVAHLGLNFDVLASARNSLDKQWFKASFILILAGYGTKMGLAPFHTWLPDAHSEAPGTVSALLSGALLNCSFLGILRFCAVSPESLIEFTNTLLTALGVLSLAVAAFFIIRQSDYKRMLAYSSVEHMGLLALFQASGFMGAGLVHLCGHSIIKMSLFLIAGNVLLCYGTRHIPDVSGIYHRTPRNAALWTAGMLMICGMPPSPLFFTEFMLLTRLSVPLAVTVLVLLFIIFAGMTGNALKMVMGLEGRAVAPAKLAQAAENLYFVPFMMLSLALASGVYLVFLLFREGGFLL